MRAIEYEIDERIVKIESDYEDKIKELENLVNKLEKQLDEAMDETNELREQLAKRHEEYLLQKIAE